MALKFPIDTGWYISRDGRAIVLNEIGCFAIRQNPGSTGRGNG
jgi:hypothetical protein